MPAQFKDKVLNQCAVAFTSLMEGVPLPPEVQRGINAHWEIFAARVADLERDSLALKARRAADRKRSRKRRG